MINDEELLGQFQSIDSSLESLRQAILSLFTQNLELLQSLGDIQRKQLELERKSIAANPELEGLPVYLAFYTRSRGKNAT